MMMMMMMGAIMILNGWSRSLLQVGIEQKYVSLFVAWIQVGKIIGGREINEGVYMYRPSCNSRWRYTIPFVFLLVWKERFPVYWTHSCCMCKLGENQKEKKQGIMWEAVVCCSLLFQCDNTEFYHSLLKDRWGGKVALFTYRWSITMTFWQVELSGKGRHNFMCYVCV